MALLTSELERIKFETGYNLLTLSALPYAIDGITQIFEQVIGPYLQSGELNHSATAVNAVAAPGLPALVTLTLTQSPTLIQVGDILVIDQGVTQEFTTAQSVSASGPCTVTCALLNQHQGTFPVTVEGGEAIVREMLRECMAVGWALGKSKNRMGIASADEVKFFATTSTQLGTRGELLELQKHWRAELCSACGVENLRAMRGGDTGGSGLCESY